MSDDRAALVAALGDYEVGGELGRGAWGIVFAARHRHLRRDVAIKRLPPAVVHDPEVRARFIHEARVLSSLDHPHIVPVYDYVERDDVCLLVMEQLAGGTVDDRAAGGQLDLPAACAIALVTAVALDHAHGRGVLHRDIKPDNLLFAADGALMKVADLGIAKVITGERTLATSDGKVLGTPAYLAPEQARGEDASPATDIYALGATLYRLLAGRMPFPPAATAMAVLYQRVYETPEDLRRTALHVPPSIAAVVMRALATDPADRYATADAFAVALAQVVTGELGRGWLDRTGIRAVLGGRIAAITETGGAVPDTASATPSERRPARDDASARRDDAGARRDADELLLARVRAGEVPLTDEERADAERLLGGHGSSPTDRLGLTSGAGPDEVRAAVHVEVARWRRRAEHPLSPRTVVTAAQALARTCESLLDRLPTQGGDG